MSHAVFIPVSSSASGDLLTPQEVFSLVNTSGPTRKSSHQLIIDLRSRSSYHKSHVPGSHSIPSGWLLSADPPDGDLILVGDSNDHSAEVIEHLHGHGYARRIRHLSGGFEAWVRQELPVAGCQRSWFPFPASQRLLVAGGGLLIAWLLLHPPVALIALA
ncbi:rhodanese-like domain-containing protein [Synechococcus sp. 1G10]|uniref:rhodanese-like domain-containing protein n=1 Tax=Synechococcus sp. 1G10 TaxID=2025605 RepID=UPI000B982CA6